MWALSHHRAKRLTRLSGLVPSGTFVAMWGSWLLLLPTMPLISAAKVLRWRGEVPLGGGGIALRECIAYGTIASEVVTHRMLLQMCCSLTMEYTMSQPLKRPFHNNLEKCPVVKRRTKVCLRNSHGVTSGKV